ncbi:MAG: hypothetical protein ACFCUE_03455 [Candidatus Bathyarchaeia archaeon]|jgi:hypothetical protein
MNNQSINYNVGEKIAANLPSELNTINTTFFQNATDKAKPGFS